MTKAAKDFKTEMVRASDLRPHPRNYRVHPEDQLAHIVESIREHGIYRNIVVAKDNTILAGHGVVEGAKKLGYDKIPVMRINVGPNAPRALKLLAADNEISRLGEINDRTLSEILREVKETDLDGLLGTGFDEMMLANLVFVTRPEGEVRNRDEAEQWVGLPEHEDADKKIQLVLQFDNTQDRDRLAKQLGLIIGKTFKDTERGSLQTAWWPPRSRNDLQSIKFDAKREKPVA